MNIDIERLKVDESLWPEGATHYDVEGSLFIKKNAGGWLHLLNGEWLSFAPVKRVIPRPEPRQVEWDGEGLPPAGCECEGYVLDTSRQWTWVYVEVLKQHNNQECAVYVPSMGVLRWCDQFRPIRTKEQREREEVITNCLRLSPMNTDDDIHPRQYLIDSLHSLYDAGMLQREPKK